MNQYIYKTLEYDEAQILHLYLANGLFAYTNNKDALFKGIKNSLDVYGVYDQKKLIGLLRTVGDENTIIYIQDICVLPEYQRQGIGTKLLQDIIGKYQHVRQIILTTDNLPKTKQFYESVGLKDFTDIGFLGFIVNK